jgi:cytochrome c553
MGQDHPHTKKIVRIALQTAAEMVHRCLAISCIVAKLGQVEMCVGLVGLVEQLRRAAVMKCAGFAMVSASAILTSSPVQALAGDLAAITKASTLDSDPRDFQAIAAVCTVCHAATQFLTTPRSSSRWQ